jgi:hypothetical protein
VELRGFEPMAIAGAESPSEFAPVAGGASGFVRFDPRCDVGLMLKGGQRREQIGRGRISAWAHHPHQALLGDVGLPAQRAEADGGVDAIAQEDGRPPPPMRFKHTLGGGGAAKARGSGGFRARPHAGGCRGRETDGQSFWRCAMGNSTYELSCKGFSPASLMQFSGPMSARRIRRPT